MAKVIPVVIFCLAEVILLCGDSVSDRVFFATKIIGISLALAALALWALCARGKDLS